MKYLSGLVIASAVMAFPFSAASAQSGWVPGSEIVGQSVQVETNGITNTVYFDQGGAARIVTPNGTSVPATWTASAGKLCLYGSAAQECWPYQSPFQAGQPATLSSSCATSSRWLAAATNPLPEPPVQQVQPEVQGERGR
jgi:hypothetical protein